MSSCDNYRDQISKALVGEISSEEQRDLELHLRACAVCRREHDLTLDMISQLRAATDVPVPHHFFVYPRTTRYSAWGLLKQLTLAWKLAATVMVVAIILIGGAALANFHGRIDNGIYTFSFGKPITPMPASSNPSAAVQDLKVELLRVVEEKSREERLQWIQAMKEEPAKKESALSVRQRKLLETALVNLERRVNGQMFTTGVALQAGWDKSLSDMYRSLQIQRQRDLVLTQERLDRLAAQGEIKSSQTDAILETLIQVAEVRLK